MNNKESITGIKDEKTPKSRMYKVDDKVVTTWNPFVGCNHNCCYCYARSIAQRSSCPLCKTFTPHWHPERLENPPKFKAGETVFVCSMGDINWALPMRVIPTRPLLQKMSEDYTDNINNIRNIIKNNPQTTFMLQSKDPKCFSDLWENYPDNLILGTTIETDLNVDLISQAPHFIDRISALRGINHNRKYITIEPILKFNSFYVEVTTNMCGTIMSIFRIIRPEFVYIGYMSEKNAKKFRLNEPTLAETQTLIKEIRNLGIEVREKTIRPAWYEKQH